MNEITLPSTPKWYRQPVVACAPDNTLVYTCQKTITIVAPSQIPDETADVKLINFPDARVISVGLNKKWGNPDKLCVSCFDDNTVKVFDLDSLKEKFSNAEHQNHKAPLCGATFANDSRVISVATDGFIVIWNIILNETKTVLKLFQPKDTVNCFAECPFETWRVAFGMQNGLVYVTDLRRDGQVIYKLRGHNKSVVSLTWCPAPINIFPQSPKNKIKTRSAPSQSKNIWTNLTHDDDTPPELTSKDDEPNDFLSECLNLKAKILGEVKKTDDNESPVPTPSDCDKVEIHEEKDGTPEKVTIELSDRVIPSHYDPSCDIFDDLIAETDTREKNEDETLEKNMSIPGNANNTTDTVTVPVPINEEEARDEFLLASSSVDRSVCIWKAGTDGNLQTMFRLNSKIKNHGPKQTWITLCWISPNTLLTSSDKAELLSWVLPKPQNTSKIFQVVHNYNSGCLFNITAPMKYSAKENWSDFQYTTRVWTNDIEDNIINYDLSNHTVVNSFTTIPAGVTVMENSPIDPNRFAIGFKTGLVKLWDLSKPHKNIITLTPIKRSHSKITALAWHPNKEMIVAYATEEGQIGYIDVNSQKSDVLHAFFKSTVYKLEWAPAINATKDKFVLYAVGDGKMAIFDMETPKGAPIELELPDKMHICRFSWKLDNSLLLVSLKEGSLLALSPSLEVIDTLYMNQKSVIHVSWHPDEGSERSRWFAASTSDGFSIYDSEVIGKSDEAVAFNDLKLSNFIGHFRAITDLRWSPFDYDRILSVGSDGVAHIWDVVQKVALATIPVPDLKSPYLTVVWSPLDPDLVLVSYDRLLKIRDINKYPPQATEVFISARIDAFKKLKTDDGQKGSAVKDNAPKKIKVAVHGAKVKEVAKNCILPSLYTSNNENLQLQVSQMKSILGELSDTSESNVLQVFGSRDNVLKLLNTSYDQHKKEAKHNFCDLISLWKGDASTCVKEAIEQNRVTPTIITLAPMVSPKLHQEACYVYAKNMLEQSNCDHMEAATYFLACHKIEEAIDCLCAGNLYREALSLAKCRLPHDSEIIIKVADKWAAYNIVTGNFEAAVYCYLSLKEYEKAAKVLSRRNNVEFLTFSAELAEKSGNKKLQNSLIAKCSELQHTNDDPLPTRSDLLLNEVNKETSIESEENESFEDAKEVVSDEE